MGLSQVEKQQQITVVQVLTELLGGLQNLDKETLASLAKDAYSLPEAEQKKADEARNNIKDYQDLVIKNKQMLADIEAGQDNLDLRTKEITDGLAQITAKKKDLDVRESDLNDKDKSLTQRAVSLDAREAKLTKGENALAQAQSDLQLNQDKLTSDQAALKAKTDQVQALLAG